MSCPSEGRGLKRLGSFGGGMGVGGSGGMGGKHPHQVARRNERERKRVQQVNNGFVTLRNHVPLGVKNKKLSKVETLRQAASYIAYLQSVLTGQSPTSFSAPVSPVTSPSYNASPFSCSEETGAYASPDFLLSHCSPADLRSPMDHQSQMAEGRSHPLSSFSSAATTSTSTQPLRPSPSSEPDSTLSFDSSFPDSLPSPVYPPAHLHSYPL